MATEARLRDTLGLPLAEQLPLLGISRTSWHEYKTGQREMPRYIARLLLALHKMDDLTLEALADHVEAERTKQN